MSRGGGARAKPVAMETARQVAMSTLEMVHSGDMEGDALGGPKSFYHDPFALLHSMGYKEKVSSVSYSMHDEVAASFPGINAIDNYEIGQVQQFIRRFAENEHGVGLAVVEKDLAPGKSMKPKAAAFAHKLETFLLQAGDPEPNPYSDQQRDNLRTLVSKWLRDSLRYDQGTIECVPRGALPFQRSTGVYEFYAAPASTFRIALDARPWNANANRPIDPMSALVPNYRPNMEGQTYAPISRRDGQPTRYVQVLHGQIVNEFSERELIFTVRNPRTDPRVNGYGWSEIEQAIANVVTILYHDQYHRNFYRGLQRGLLALKGRWGKQQLARLRRHFGAWATGTANSHRLPFLELDPSGDVKFVDFHKSEQDTGSLEFAKFVFTQFASVRGVDPAEVGWNMSTVGARPFMEQDAGDWRVRAGRQKWLPGILAALADALQRVLDQVDDHFEVVWKGLDQPSREQLHKERMEKVATYLSIDEARAQDGLEALDMEAILAGKKSPPSNPTYMQYLQMQQMARTGEPDTGAPGGQPSAGAAQQAAGDDQAGDDEVDDGEEGGRVLPFAGADDKPAKKRKPPAFAGTTDDDE